MQVMELFRRNIRPRDIMTEEAFRNALTMDMALGCSTNSMLHLPAIANECGIRLNVEIANEISEKTPNLCHLAPAGPTYMEDLNEAGGVYAVMNEINKLGLLHTELMTCTGKTVAENIQGCVNLNPEVIRPVENPYSKTGGIAVLKGNWRRILCGQAFGGSTGDAAARGPRSGIRLRGGRNGGDYQRQNPGRRCSGDPL